MLDASGFAPEYVDVGGSDFAYHELLERLWREAADDGLLLVEQDMVPSPSQLRELAACPHDWCAFPYRTPRGIIPALGCVKFAAGLLRQYPDVMTQAGLPDHDLVEPRHWWRLDVRLERALFAAGAVRHLHRGTVPHLHFPDPV